MGKKIVLREKLFSFKDSPVTEKNVFLVIREGEEPRITTEPGTFAKVGNDFALSSLLKISSNIRDVMQFVGDGPETEVFPKEHVEKVLMEAFERLMPNRGEYLGRFQIVWVPDDGLPF